MQPLNRSYKAMRCILVDVFFFYILSTFSKVHESVSSVKAQLSPQKMKATIIEHNYLCYWITFPFSLQSLMAWFVVFNLSLLHSSTSGLNLSLLKSMGGFLFPFNGNMISFNMKEMSSMLYVRTSKMDALVNHETLTFHNFLRSLNNNIFNIYLKLLKQFWFCLLLIFCFKTNYRIWYRKWWCHHLKKSIYCTEIGRWHSENNRVILEYSSQHFCVTRNSVIQQWMWYSRGQPVGIKDQRFLLRYFIYR